MKNYIIGILSVLVLVLGGYLVYDKFIDKKEDVKDTSVSEPEIKEYKEYKKGDKITLSDGYTYIVLEDSDKTKDYVTAISSVSYYFSGSDVKNTETEVYVTNTDAYDELFKALYGEVNYDEALSTVLDIVNTNFLKINANELKEVDGYKMRLLTLNDLYNYYGEDSFNKAIYNIQYTGSENIFKTVTMIDTKTITTEGKNMTLASIIGNNIEVYALGIPGINPVVNVYKSNIK